ncbi:hypothetical protein P167DRAFT_540243 [Morchella conica CCBAS932]|uniref:Uncharacterized protein n=1 Tax=Morchella conica CCBAS932 TaxID=1392247 RepID=A0A3N4K9T2_9PEZI|nr:hypothetical protein P167DRAFT_540243 [Morchella conica CCBAS932]
MEKAPKPRLVDHEIATAFAVFVSVCLYYVVEVIRYSLSGTADNRDSDTAYIRMVMLDIV